MQNLVCSKIEVLNIDNKHQYEFTIHYPSFKEKILNIMGNYPYSFTETKVFYTNDGLDFRDNINHKFQFCSNITEFLRHCYNKFRYDYSKKYLSNPIPGIYSMDIKNGFRYYE